MIVSYDIDGVLAAQPPQCEIKWGKMNGVQRKARKDFLYDWYENAEKLIEPVEPQRKAQIQQRGVSSVAVKGADFVSNRNFELLLMQIVCRRLNWDRVLYVRE